MTTKTDQPLGAIGMPAVTCRELEQRFFISTVGDLLAFEHRHEMLEDMASHLGRSASWVSSYVEKARAFAPEASVGGGLCTIGPQLLGLRCEESLAETAQWPFAEAVALPDCCELFKRSLPVVGQGARGTCVPMSFAKALGFLERVELSPEFSYFACKSFVDQEENAGTSFSSAIRALKEHGICREVTWPHSPALPEAHKPAPEGAEQEALLFRLGGIAPAPRGPDLLNAIKQGLCGTTVLTGRPMIIGVPVHDTWLNAETRRTGKVFVPGPSAHLLGHHAMLIEGYDETGVWSRAPGGGVMIVRNSWENWALENPFRMGYAIMPYAFVDQHCFAAFALITKDEAERQLDDEVVSEDRPTVVSVREAVAQAKVPNHNILIAGASGTGKTQTAKVLLQQEIERGDSTKNLILDNNNEYDSFVEAVGGKIWDVARHGLPFNAFVPLADEAPEMYVEGLLANFEASTGMGALQIDELRSFLRGAVIQRMNLPEIRRLGEQKLTGSITSWLRPVLLLCGNEDRKNDPFGGCDVVSLKLNGLQNMRSRKAAGMFAIGEIYRRCANGDLGPVRVVIEEAQLMAGMPWLERLLREGRKFGISTTVITQCVADIDRYVLTNCAQWLIFQCDSANARKAAASADVDDSAKLAREIVCLQPFEAVHICRGVVTRAAGDRFRPETDVRRRFAPEKAVTEIAEPEEAATAGPGATFENQHNQKRLERGGRPAKRLSLSRLPERHFCSSPSLDLGDGSPGRQAASPRSVRVPRRARGRIFRRPRQSRMPSTLGL